MAKFQRTNMFTAQGINVRALMALYSNLDTTDETEEPEEPNLVPIVVFCAFSIESYLNSLGSRNIDFWDEIERLPWTKKINILHKIAGKKENWGAEPLQFSKEVFAKRDKLAHGKPTEVKAGIISGSTVYHSKSEFRPQPEWFEEITIEWVIASRSRFHSLMTYLAGLYGYDQSDYLEVSEMKLDLIE